MNKPKIEQIKSLEISRITQNIPTYIVKTASSEAYLERLHRRTGSGDCELHY